MNLLKDYVAEFCGSDIEFTHLIKTVNLLAKITYELPESQILAEGPIKEPDLGYVCLKKMTNRKEFFRVLDKHLVPSNILQNFIANAAKSDAPDPVKKKFVYHLKWYLEVRSWLHNAYLFISEDAN